MHFLLYGFLTLLAAILAATLMLPSDENQPSPPPEASVSPDTLRGTRGQHAAIQPIPELPVEVFQSSKVLLGEKLFNDPGLSGDGTISCASCHILNRGGADNRKLSTGVANAIGEVNTPTVFNSVFGFRQFWDGRANDLAEQVAGPLLNPSEMASNWVIAIQRVKEKPDYREAFKREYDGEITEKTITDAIVRYEATLLTPNAPFDRFLKGDTAMISDTAKEGYRRFSDYGCVSCHQGINVGGNLFQRFGVMGDYFADRGNPAKVDQGRYNVTGNEEDRYVFKVPSLRNVALTAPYFHDGSAATLEQAVDIMGNYQLGRPLSDEDRRYIVAFLESLTGEFRGKPLQP
jgi:cytochrome c peroxidase